MYEDPGSSLSSAMDGLNSAYSDLDDAYDEYHRRLAIVIGVSVGVGLCCIAAISFCCYKFVCKKDSSATPVVMAKEVNSAAYNPQNTSINDPNISKDSMYPGGVQMTHTGQGQGSNNTVAMKGR